MEFNLDDHGFTVVEDFFTEDDFLKFKTHGHDFEFPFQDGDHKSAKVDFDFSRIVEKASELTGKKYSIFFQKTYFKTAFESSYEMYHQDYFYRKDDGHPNENYLQAFIALEDLDYAPLNVFVGSHKLGVLPHTFGMERQGMGKYRVRNNHLREIASTFMPVKLRKGSVLFFDYLLVHGSASNASPVDQPRAVVQLCEKPLAHNNPGSDRRHLEIKVLEQILAAKKASQPEAKSA